MLLTSSSTLQWLSDQHLSMLFYLCPIRDPNYVKKNSDMVWFKARVTRVTFSILINLLLYLPLCYVSNCYVTIFSRQTEILHVYMQFIPIYTQLPVYWVHLTDIDAVQLLCNKSYLHEDHNVSDCPVLSLSGKNWCNCMIIFQFSALCVAVEL